MGQRTRRVFLLLPSTRVPEIAIAREMIFRRILW